MPCFQFTTLIGSPARNAATLAIVDSISLPRASAVAHAMCGVRMQRGALSKGLSGRIGSTETTSRAAPASSPSSRAWRQIGVDDQRAAGGVDQER